MVERGAPEAKRIKADAKDCGFSGLRELLLAGVYATVGTRGPQKVLGIDAKTAHRIGKTYDYGYPREAVVELNHALTKK